jgi:hypothetical protein
VSSDQAGWLSAQNLDLSTPAGVLGNDPVTGRSVGNFPQALNHIAVINTARHLSAAAPAETIDAEQRTG